MPSPRPAARTAVGAVGALLVGLVTVAGSTATAAPAHAAEGDWVRYDGESLLGARVPAEPVSLSAFSTASAAEAQFLLDGEVVAEDATVVADGSGHRADATVDLTGHRGSTTLEVRYVTAAGETHTFDKRFTTVAPSSSRPGPSTTGVPAGTTLTAHGHLDARTDGAVYDGLDIEGCVRVFADDVVIRNSRIRCDDPDHVMAVEVTSDAEGLVVEDTEIDGRGTTEIGVGWGRYTLRRLDIHHVTDGARFGGRVTIEDSWIHDMVKIKTLHPDALQTTSASDVVIRGNVLNPRNGGTYHNAAIMLGSELNSKIVEDVLIEDNVLDGGNYSINIRGDINAEGLTIRANTFGSASRYGAVVGPPHVALGAGNVLAATGDPVVVSKIL